MLTSPWATMPPESSWSVGRRSMPPMVVEDRSPMVCTALMTYTTAREMQALTSKVTPKWSGMATWNHPAGPTEEKSTMPRHRARRYPAIMPHRMAPSLSTPLPKFCRATTTTRVTRATAQFFSPPKPSLPAPPAMCRTAVG